VPLTVDVPNVANATEIWQTFRDAWGKAVQAGEGDLEATITTAAEKADSLLAQN